MYVQLATHYKKFGVCTNERRRKIARGPWRFSPDLLFPPAFAILQSTLSSASRRAPLRFCSIRLFFLFSSSFLTRLLLAVRFSVCYIFRCQPLFISSLPPDLALFFFDRPLDALTEQVIGIRLHCIVPFIFGSRRHFDQEGIVQ